MSLLDRSTLHRSKVAFKLEFCGNIWKSSKISSWLGFFQYVMGGNTSSCISYALRPPTVAWRGLNGTETSWIVHSVSLHSYLICGQLSWITTRLASVLGLISGNVLKFATNRAQKFNVLIVKINILEIAELIGKIILKTIRSECSRATLLITWSN